QRRQGRDGYQRKDDGLERKVGGVHEAERGARIVHAREVEKARNHRYALVERKTAPDDGLDGLVEDDNDDGDQKVALARVSSHRSGIDGFGKGLYAPVADA